MRRGHGAYGIMDSKLSALEGSCDWLKCKVDGSWKRIERCTELSPMGRFGTKLNGFELVPLVIAKLAMDSDD